MKLVKQFKAFFKGARYAQSIEDNLTTVHKAAAKVDQCVRDMTDGKVYDMSHTVDQTAARLTTFESKVDCAMKKQALAQSRILESTKEQSMRLIEFRDAMHELLEDQEKNSSCKCRIVLHDLRKLLIL